MGDINHIHRWRVDPVIMVIRPPLLEWWGHRSATTWLVSGAHSLISAAFCPISIILVEGTKLGMYLHVIWISIIFFMLYRKIIPCVIQDLTDNYNESASFAFQSPQSFVYCVLRFISFVLIQKFYTYTRKDIPSPNPTPTPPQSLRLSLLNFIFN